MSGKFQERWRHEVRESAFFNLTMVGGRPTIGFFNQWAKRRAAELGLRLIATDHFKWWRNEADSSFFIEADVMLEDHGDTPLIDCEAHDLTGMGVLPYIRDLKPVN